MAFGLSTDRAYCRSVREPESLLLVQNGLALTPEMQLLARRMHMERTVIEWEVGMTFWAWKALKRASLWFVRSNSWTSSQMGDVNHIEAPDLDLEKANNKVFAGRNGLKT